LADVTLLDHRDPLVAKQIHEVLLLAYAQEAELLKVKHFEPLERTASDILSSTDYYLGAFLGKQLVGSLSVGPDDEPAQITITSLVVHPSRQRQGIGRSLVLEAIRRANGAVLSVSTAANNAPALCLYRGFGFVEYRWGTVGLEHIPLVKLRRPRSNPSIEGTSTSKLRLLAAAPHVKR
jgi:ribosomal protein S18 acetylase RimI-like enzyme